MFVPFLVREQMTMHNFTMLKVFLTATAVGSIGISILSSLNIRPRRISPKRSFAGIPYGANIIGGAILGIGMTLAGACPGTVLVQLGAGVSKASVVYAGGLLAALTYGYIEPMLRGHLTESPGKAILFNHSAVSIAFASLLIAVSFAAEKFRPFTVDFDMLYHGLGSRLGWSLDSWVWNPIAAGALIGLLQIPSLLTIKVPLGTSSAYCMMAGCVAHQIDSKANVNAPYFAKFFGLDEFGKLGLVTGLVLGGWISSTLSHIPKEILANPMPTPIVFVGGYLLVLGARLAGGCTSGHGLSGMGGLGVASFVTVAAMFAGGMLAALVI